MRLLLDTHTFLWWVTADERLSRRARGLIADGTNEVFFSAASAWEIAIKARLKRIRVPGDVEAFIPQQIAANGFQALPVHVRHALKVRALPDLHRDPFDRMLVAQAMSEDMPLVSGDPQVARYPIQVLW